jgi:hypothetical protein
MFAAWKLPNIIKRCPNCTAAHTDPRVSQVRGVQTALRHTRIQGFPKYEASKLHYRTHGSKGFPSTRCPNCTTAHTDPRVSSVQTSQLWSDPMATQADPASIPSLIYNTNKKTGWRNRSKSRILRGERGCSPNNRNPNKPNCFTIHKTQKR